MPEILAPLTSEYTLMIPSTPSALIGWVIGLVMIIGLGLVLRDRSFKLDRPTLLWLAILSVLILILTPFIGVLPRKGPIVGSGEVPFQHLMFLAAIPWMVAGGVLGVLPAALLGGISGLLLAYLDTHNIFTPLVVMSVAIFFSWSVRQRYRTALFKWLRFPVIAAAVSLLATAPLVFIALILSTSGPTAGRIALAIARFPVVMFALGGMVLIGGVVSMIVQAIAPERWGQHSPLRPAPGEALFRYRLLGYAVPTFVIVLAVVLISSWSGVQHHGSKLLSRQLTGTTGSVAESSALFFETGGRLIQELTMNPQLLSGSAEQVVPLFDQSLSTNAFFDWIGLFDIDGNLIVGVPQGSLLDLPLILNQADLIRASSQQQDPYLFLGDTGEGSQYGQVAFWTVIGEQPDEPQRILWGHTMLDKNAYAQSFFTAINTLTEQGGSVSFVSSDGKVLYQRGGEESDIKPPATKLTTATFYQTTTQDGRTQANYYQPVDGTNLGILATLPTLIVQEMAWEIAQTNLVVAAGIMVLIFFGVWIALSPVVNEMETIALAINAVAVGDLNLDNLETRINQRGGYFKTGFKNMVQQQKKRMDRQEKLLSVSSKVAGQLNLGESLHIILSAALLDGVSAARIVMINADLHDAPSGSQDRFGLGQYARLLAGLDQAVVDLAQEGRMRVLHSDEIRLKLPTGEEMPELTAVAIFPMKWKDLRLGVFWVAFSENLIPDGEVLEYLFELAQIVSLAMINAKTFQDSQLSSALMATIFDLTPDVVLIADQQGQVLFNNPAADHMFDRKGGAAKGKTLSAIFTAQDIMKLDLGREHKSKAREVYFDDGKSYELISSTIQINPRQAATALIFKDLTQRRKADALKNEFVTMVSHELRSPLTLILGYAKILRLTGNLNEQQDAYISKIIDGVEEMKSLVHNLLDIGRLEGRDPLDIRQFTVSQLINRVVDSLEAQAKQKNIALSVNLPGDPLIIEGDQTFIAQALKNLLENAIKFSKMEGEVKVSVRENGNRVIIAIHDKGIGIAPLDQRLLFNKFSRVSTQAGMENEGSGLGLAIVKSIAERHGGEVRLESQLGKGSTFYFDIPSQQPRK